MSLSAKCPTCGALGDDDIWMDMNASFSGTWMCKKCDPPGHVRALEEPFAVIRPILLGMAIGAWLMLSSCAHDHLPKDFRGFDVPAAYGGAV